MRNGRINIGEPVVNWIRRRQEQWVQVLRNSERQPRKRQREHGMSEGGDGISVVDCVCEHWESLHMRSDGDMNTTTFEQLTVRLGQEYLYVHHGDCEHTLVFQQLRAISNSELVTLHRASFPRSTRAHKRTWRKCAVCGKSRGKPAELVCFNDRLAVSNPCFYCTVRSTHFNVLIILSYILCLVHIYLCVCGHCGLF